MKEYPRLAEMGVTHPQEIAEYSVSSVDYVDFLRIFYVRPKNSILPVSRTYRFPRVQDKASSGDSPGAEKVVMKTSTALREALDELKEIEKAQSQKHDIAKAMQEQIMRLEEDIALHTEHLKTLITKMEAN